MTFFCLFKAYGKQLGAQCNQKDPIPCGSNLVCGSKGICECVANFVSVNTSCGKFLI